MKCVNMKKRTIIYISIAIICVIAIILGVYYEVFENTPTIINSNTIVDNTIDNNKVDDEIDDPEELKTEFYELFNNSFDDQGYDVTTIEKLEGFEEQEIIFAAYNIKEEKDEKYSVNINLPVFNVKGDVAANFNSITQSLFANKANDVLSQTTQYTIYDVEYVAYLNENILSLIIKSTLKEGSNPQRIIVQTYNYDIETGKEVTLNEVLDSKLILQKDVNKKIERQVEEANRQAEEVAEALIQSGQAVYRRDTNNAMYVTDNVRHFFIGLDGEIYIVYPYGNSDFTSEIDIIKI